ncbi:hypothetical protein ACMD2_09690 [Ananas comosus]|uniref:Uncharacterized protein n=1 Tax=Ananas comosus TaxID=4615 RepID=A0A199VSL8_ANACO|nr:hypothetical protein ACMD2_09690 [Ananas comosus]
MGEDEGEAAEADVGRGGRGGTAAVGEAAQPRMRKKADWCIGRFPFGVGTLKRICRWLLENKEVTWMSTHSSPELKWPSFCNQCYSYSSTFVGPTRPAHANPFQGTAGFVGTAWTPNFDLRRADLVEFHWTVDHLLVDCVVSKFFLISLLDDPHIFPYIEDVNIIWEELSGKGSQVDDLSTGEKVS